jgi:hypothetical protein
MELVIGGFWTCEFLVLAGDRWEKIWCREKGHGNGDVGADWVLMG